MKILYTTKAINTNGRDGEVQVENSMLKFDMALPVELGGRGKVGANPEQLFAAGYSACFGSAVQHVVRVNKISLKSAEVSIKVSIGEDENGGFKLATDITLITTGLDQAAADALIKEAHQVCPYSKATRGNIQVSLTAITQ